MSLLEFFLRQKLITLALCIWNFNKKEERKTKDIIMGGGQAETIPSCPYLMLKQNKLQESDDILIVLVGMGVNAVRVSLK